MFTEIVNLLEFSPDPIDKSIGDFYTSMTTDKRFLMVNGMWDLRTRHTSDKMLTSVDDEDEEEVDEVDDDGMEEDDYEEDIDSDVSYDDTDDDGLSDLVVLDEDDMDSEN